MSFAKEGYVFIAIAVLIAAAAYGAAIALRSFGLWLGAFALTLVAIWVAYFFRDPERLGDRGDRLVVSPADRKFIMITEVAEPAFISGAVLRISVFMNVVNVHVNRYPVNGKVAEVLYNKGKFINAARDKVDDRASAGVTVLAELHR